MSRIALATTSTAFAGRVQAALGSLDGEVERWYDERLLGDPRAAIDAISAGEVGIAVLGPGIPDDIILSLARTFDDHRPEISVVVVTTPTPELWEEALRAGVDDILAPDAVDDDIVAAFQRAMARTARRRANLVASEPRVPSARIITVVSPKGGSGKTTVATNLAVGLARADEGRVAIIDLDLQFGDVASSLQLTPEHTMVDVARAGGGLNATTLKVFLTPHDTGLYVLCAPESPGEGEEITTATLQSVLGLMAAEFSAIIIDTAAGLDEHTLTALEASSDVLFVCTMDVPSIRSLRKEVEALDRLQMTRQRRRLVLNRADSRVGLEPADIEATLGLPVDVEVPSSRTIPLSTNQGVPVMAADGRSPARRPFQTLTDLYRTMPADAGRGLLGRRRRRT